MDSVQIRDEFIKLGQALKLARLVESGADAKEVITSGQVKVNGQTELQRGKKLVAGDVVEFGGRQFKVAAK